MGTPRLMQQQVLDWIEEAVAAGFVPDEPNLGLAFPLIDARQMRAVLADLADAGKVTVNWKVEPFTVGLGRKKSAFAAAKPVSASIVRRDEDGERVQVHPETVVSNPHVIRKAQARHRVTTADETADRIKRILARGKAAVMPELQVATARKAPRPAQIASRDDRRQINVHFPAARFADVERRAEQAGTTPSAWAREIVMAVLDEPVDSFDAGRKPFIRAAVIRSAARDEMPLHDFVTMLIERGFASYEADAALERAA